MPGRYRVIDVARAAEMDRRQIEALIARGLIVPEHTPEEGGARQFTEEEAIKIAVLGEVMRLKIPAIRNYPPPCGRAGSLIQSGYGAGRA